MIAAVVILTVLLLAAIGGLAALTVWGLKWRDRADSAESDLHQCDHAYEDELRDRKAAQKRAADALLKLSELEAQPKRLGYGYSTKNAGVANVMQTLQGMLSRLQAEDCRTARDSFATQKKTVIDSLRAVADAQQPPGSLRCSDLAATLREVTRLLREDLASDLNSDEYAAIIAAEVEKVWTAAATQVCNRDGILDFGLLEAFMDAVFDAVCSPAATATATATTSSSSSSTSSSAATNSSSLPPPRTSRY
jgi:hypothetical protein